MLKFRLFTLIFLSLLAALSHNAQTSDPKAETWSRVETDEKDLSFAIPPGFLVDAESGEFGLKFRLFGGTAKTSMNFSIAKGRTLIPRRSESENRVDLKLGDFSVVVSRFSGGNTNGLTIFAIRKDTMYTLSSTANTSDDANQARFLYSIRINGEALFKQKEPATFQENKVAVADLRTSDEITEARKRKFEKVDRKIVYQDVISSNAADETIGLDRAPVIIEQPRPDFRPEFRQDVPNTVVMRARLRVQLLATGQIGDIVVLESTSRPLAELCVRSAQKIRFVPATKGGVATDSFKVVEYMFQFYSGPNLRS